MKSNKLWAGVIALAVLAPTPVWAWGNLGHQSVAEFASRRLTKKAQKLVFEILGAEPMAVAATFPDEVRSDAHFKAFGNYHFFEIAEGLTPAKAVAEQAGKKSADTVISKFGDRLLLGRLSRDQKILFLRYLIHVIGDVHQPLHVGNGVDMGANLCVVDWVHDPKPVVKHEEEEEKPAEVAREVERTNLHTVWDERVFEYAEHDYVRAHPPLHIGEKRYYNYVNFVDEATKDGSPYATKEALADLEKAATEKPLEWYAQSRALHAKVYPDGEETFAKPELRNYCKRVDPKTHKTLNGAFEIKKVRTLKEAYGRKALELATWQVLKGGARLAATLNRLAEDGRIADIDVGAIDDLLLSVQIEKE